MKKKIFIGNYDIGSVISSFKITFKSLGIETITAMDTKAPTIVRGNVDYNFTDYTRKKFTWVKPSVLRHYLCEGQNIERRVWRKAIKECEIFIFIWSTFKKDYSDIAELKKLGKKVVFVFCGDDARWFHAAKQEYEFYGMRAPIYDDGYDYGLKGLEERLSRIRMAEKYADFIFSRLDQAQLQLKPYYRWNMMVRMDDGIHNPVQREVRPKVLHAPSNRSAKGTKFILEAFERLKKEGIDFEVVLLENVPNTEAVKIYSDADIIIDQLIFPGTGKFATEALAAGKVVLGHMAYDRYPQKNPSDCPIIDVNPDTIYEKLKAIILDYPKRKELALKSRDYVKKYLDEKLFCKKVLDLCSGKQMDPDYYPTFFRENFVPETTESIEVYNNWTKVVRDCDWYRKSIPSGERAGLKF